ncbi:unnamed protein product [Closterium sp. NIES-54]
MATMKLIAGADVAEQQLGDEEALLILPHSYDPDEEDEPAYCFLAPAPEEPASMEALAGPDREKWLVSRDAEYQSLLENGTWDLVVLPEEKTAFSSVESEYMAMFHGVKELIWLRRLLEEIGQEQKVATQPFCDSKGALGMARNAVLHGLNKHMRIKWHCLRTEVKKGTVNPIYIKTHQQPADFLTKRLADEPHWRCVRMSGMSMN